MEDIDFEENFDNNKQGKMKAFLRIRIIRTKVTRQDHGSLVRRGVEHGI